MEDMIKMVFKCVAMLVVAICFWVLVFDGILETQRVHEKKSLERLATLEALTTNNQ
jgi:hypothetical protein